jgi:curved DNA-binding protein CbpA
MGTMNIQQCYRILNIPPQSSNEAVASAYKKLAVKLHPDRNRDRLDWAHEAMTNLNIAYSTIMSFRFENTREPEPRKKAEPEQKRGQARNGHSRKPDDRLKDIEEEFIIQSFIKIRETAKESLYRFFQYNLYNLIRRETVQNQAVFNSVVHSLRRIYHNLADLSKRTRDGELLEHFSIFQEMVFNFYRAAECLNINDSYASQYEVDAYRLYRKGDDALHRAQKELFYDRHNRGFMKNGIVNPGIQEAITCFRHTLSGFQKSSWTVEAGIKLQYAQSLQRYVNLFFTKS